LFRIIIDAFIGPYDTHMDNDSCVGVSIYNTPGIYWNLIG